MSNRGPLADKYTAAAVRELADQIDVAADVVFSNINEHEPILHALLNQDMTQVELDAKKQLQALDKGSLTQDSARAFLDRYPVNVNDIILDRIQRVEEGPLQELRAKIEDVRDTLGARGGRNAGKPYNQVLSDEFALNNAGDDQISLDEANKIISKYQGDTQDIIKRVVNEAFPQKAAPATPAPTPEASYQSEHEDDTQSNTSGSDSDVSTDIDEQASPEPPAKTRAGWVHAQRSTSETASITTSRSAQLQTPSAPTINSESVLKPLQELQKTLHDKHPKMQSINKFMTKMEQDCRIFKKPPSAEDMKQLDTLMKSCPKAADAYNKVQRAMKGEAPAAKTGLLDKLKSTLPASKSPVNRGADFNQAYEAAAQQKTKRASDAAPPAKTNPEITMGRR
jgi:hypothetical protein